MSITHSFLLTIYFYFVIYTKLNVHFLKYGQTAEQIGVAVTLRTFNQEAVGSNIHLALAVLIVVLLSTSRKIPT
jgi:hypothetical protein